MKNSQQIGIILIFLLVVSSINAFINLQNLNNSVQGNLNTVINGLDSQMDPQGIILGKGNNVTADFFCENITLVSNFTIRNAFLNFNRQKTLYLPLISGYKIYKVQVTIDKNQNLTAVPDYTVSATSTSQFTTIQGPNIPLNTTIQDAGQEFSLAYRSYFYNASLRMAIGGFTADENGSIQLRNNTYSGAILNDRLIPAIVGPILWHNYTYNMILNANSYEIIINGTSILTYPGRQYRWYHPTAGAIELKGDIKQWSAGWANAYFDHDLIYCHLPLNIIGTSPRQLTCSEVSLKINKTLVNNNFITFEQKGITNLNFTTSLSSTINLMTIRLYYVKDNISTPTSYYAQVNQAAIKWNITIGTAFISNCINNYYGINVTIPSDWVVQSILNGSPLSKYSNLNWIQLSRKVTIKNASAGSQPWILNCTAPNYINRITLEKRFNPITYVNITSSPIVNITEIIRINATLRSSAITTGDGNLTIFDYNSNANYSQVLDLVAPKNGVLSFKNWDIAKNATSNGTYTIQVIWFNGTEVGIRNTALKIIHHTQSVLMIDKQLRIEPSPLINKSLGFNNIINITVFYNRTLNPTGISTPNATYTIVNKTGGVWWSNKPLGKEILGKGMYNVSLNVTLWKYGIYFIEINLNLSGYLSQYRNITLNLIYDTILTLIQPTNPYSSYYPENVTVALSYSRIGVGIIPDALVRYYRNSSGPFPISYNGSLYALRLNSTAYGISINNITIVASKLGYNPRQITLYWIILEFNTTLMRVEPTGLSVKNYYSENLTIRVNYTRQTGEKILNANVRLTINGSAPYSLSWMGGLYRIQLNSSDYGVGTYNISILASLLGYHMQSINFIWIVQTCPTDYLLYVNWSSPVGQNQFYFGQQMKITIWYHDTQHNKVITNALVNVTLPGGLNRTLVDESNGNYSIVLNPSSPGRWDLVLIIRKPNYRDYAFNLILYARYNTTLHWVSKFPTEVSPGQTISIIVKMTHNEFGKIGQPIGGQNITFKITTNLGVLIRSNFTDSSGMALYNYVVLSGVTTIQIEAIFGGNITEFNSSISLEQPIKVIYGGFWEKYWWTIVIGAALLVVVVAAVRSRQRARALKELKKKEIMSSFQDVTKILHLVVIHKGSGSDIFDYKIQERLDPTLLAGFIQAVKEFGRELDKGAK